MAERIGEQCPICDGYLPPGHKSRHKKMEVWKLRNDHDFLWSEVSELMGLTVNTCKTYSRQYQMRLNYYARGRSKK